MDHVEGLLRGVMWFQQPVDSWKLLCGEQAEVRELGTAHINNGSYGQAVIGMTQAWWG